MQYSSTVRVQSEVLEDVSFEVRKPSYGRRLEFDTLNASFRDQVREIARQHRALREQYDAILADHEHTTERAIADATKAYKLIEAPTEGETAEFNAQVAALEAASADVDETLIERMNELGEKSLRLTSTEYNPRRIAWGLASIDGLSVDGEAVTTAEALIAHAPYELTMEVLRAVDTVSALSSEQLKNLPSPITFSALVEPTKNDTTASAVRVPEFTGDETAGA
jgi:hypothetical protein